jgi:hypothetical protein
MHHKNTANSSKQLFNHQLCLSRLLSVVYPLFRVAAFGIASDTQSCIDWLFDFGTGENGQATEITSNSAFYQH